MANKITEPQKEPTKKWYQRVWNGVKKGAKLTYQAIVSNTGAMIVAALGLGLGIATGGAAPIAIAAVVLGVKIVKTGLDAHKAMKTRTLDIENSALVDFATALYVQQKTLELQPKLLSTTKSLAPLELDHNGKKLTYNKSLNRVHKIVGAVNAGLDIATIAMNPIKGIHAAQHIKAGVETAEQIKNILEVIGSTGEVLASAAATKELHEMISEHLSHHPEAQEQLVDLINSGRGTEGAAYLSLDELRAQTQAIKNENQALVATLKEDDFYSLTPTQIREKFEEHSQEISSNALPVQQQENIAKRIWHGIKDALNPYSKYHPDIQKHSGLTAAVREENTERATPPIPVVEKAVTRDDFALNMKSNSKSTTITAEQRQQDLARFKADSQQLNAKITNKAHNIGNTLHSKGHSQSATAKPTSSVRQRRSNSVATKSR